MKFKKIPLYIKILIGMALGLSWGIAASSLGLIEFTQDWIKPFGTIFINSLKLIAVPLVLVSLIDGISNLSDVHKLSSIGGKTILLYFFTTILAVSVGLISVNLIQPGNYITSERRDELKQEFAADMDTKIATAHSTQEQGPLSILENIVPNNLFSSLSDNRNMLQMIFFAILFGVAMVTAPKDKEAPVKKFFNRLNTIILAIVSIIMQYAPIGVFALLASLNLDMGLVKALSVYSLNVVLGLVIMIFAVYPVMLRFFTKTNYIRFTKGIFKAQILGFSTSSSAATLPVTKDCVEQNLGVPESISSFVLPLGATINMDGTSIHQGVSAVFIAQAFGIELTLADQITILLTAVLASIGAAAVPSAGIIMLIIVLESIGIDPAGLALILAIDRPLDMLRTTVNITGDSTIALIIANAEKKNLA